MLATEGCFLARIHATVRDEVTEPGVGAGEAEGREDAFVESPTGGAVEMGTGWYEASIVARRGDAGDDLLGPLPCPKDFRFRCHGQGGDVGAAVRVDPAGVDSTGVDAENEDALGRTVGLPNGKDRLAGWEEADGVECHVSLRR